MPCDSGAAHVRRRCGAGSSPCSTASARSTVTKSANRGTATCASSSAVRSHVQRGADAQPGVVQQLQPLPGDLRPAGQRPQLGGVPQRHHRPHAGRRRGPWAAGSPPAAGPRRRCTSSVAARPEISSAAVSGSRPTVRRRAAPRHPAGSSSSRSPRRSPAAAARRSPTMSTPFAHGVQHRVVVLVHAGHLGRGQAVGLPPQPPAHQRRPAGGHHERAGAGAEDDRQLPGHRAGHVLDPQPGGHQAHDLAVSVVDGDGGLDLLAERAVARSPCTPSPASDGPMVPDEPSSRSGPAGGGCSGCPSVSMTTMKSTPAALRAASVSGWRILLGSGLSSAATTPGECANVWATATERRGLREGVPVRLEDKGEDAPGHEQHNQRHLEDEHLPGDASRASADQGPERKASPVGETIRHVTFLALAILTGHRPLLPEHRIA